jgi:hypothetical protein
MLNDPSAMLPQQEHNDTSLYFTQENGEIVLTPLEIVAQLKLSINGLHLTTTADLNAAKISKVKLCGCYSCEVGAQLLLSCQIDFGTTMAHISCPSDIHFPLMCGNAGAEQTVRIYTTKAYLNEDCKLPLRAIQPI